MGQPRRVGDEQEAREPQRVEGGLRPVPPTDRVDRVHRVGDAERGERGGQREPHRAGAPAHDREHPEHGADEHDVTQRVREVHDGVERRRVRAVGRGFEEQRDPGRGDHQHDDDAVEPTVELEDRHAVTDEQRERDDDQRVPREPEDVGQADQHLGVVAHRGDRVADRPARERDPDHEPGEPAAGGAGRSHEAEHDRHPLRPGADPLVEGLVHPLAAEAHESVGAEQHDDATESPPRDPDPPGLPLLVLLLVFHCGQSRESPGPTRGSRHRGCSTTPRRRDAERQSGDRRATSR